MSNIVLKQMNKLRDESGMNSKQLTQVLGISSTSFTDWNKGRAKPSLDAVQKFAEYFNVSADYIIFGEDNQRLEYSYDEKELIRKYNCLPSELKQRLKAYLDGMLAVVNEK